MFGKAVYVVNFIHEAITYVAFGRVLIGYSRLRVLTIVKFS